jgi:hypothetical protein
MNFCVDCKFHREEHRCGHDQSNGSTCSEMRFTKYCGELGRLYEPKETPCPIMC